MKKLAIIVLVLLSFNSFGQDFVVENIDHNNVIYRGYENKFLFGQIGGTSEEVQMEAINCEVSKLDGNENTYIIKTKSKAKTAKINFISNGRITDSATFIVQNLPAPSLFWGSHKTGSNVSNSSEIQIKYCSGITLKSSFEIVRWKCSQKDMNFEGEGNLLSQEMLDLTKLLATGETIIIEVEVKSADGIIHKLVGSWTK